jgi:hypothetical protein
MKIKQLIVKLQKLDPNLSVVCCSEDADLLKVGQGFMLFEIDGVTTVEAERTRVDGKPYFKLGPGPRSSRHAVLDISSEV